MTTLQRKRLGSMAGLAVLALATLASYLVLASYRGRALAAELHWSDCQSLKLQILAYSKEPAKAQADALKQPDLAQRIEAACRSATVLPASVERISPESPRRLGDGPYKEVPTQVSLGKVTLRQVLFFLHALSNSAADGSGPGLRVESLRLSAPRGVESSDQWKAEMVLTYLVYAPSTPAPGSPAPGFSSDGSP